MPVNSRSRQRPSYYALRMGCGEQLGLSLKLPEHSSVDSQMQREATKPRKERSA